MKSMHLAAFAVGSLLAAGCVINGAASGGATPNSNSNPTLSSPRRGAATPKAPAAPAAAAPQSTPQSTAQNTPVSGGSPASPVVTPAGTSSSTASPQNTARPATSPTTTATTTPAGNPSTPVGLDKGAAPAPTGNSTSRPANPALKLPGR